MSFSIRDEERRKVVLRIAKPHCPIQVLGTFLGKDLSHLKLIQSGSALNSVNYHGYVGLSDRNETQWIFLNDRSIYCPLISRLIKTAFEERSDLSSNRGSSAQDLHDKNMFVIFFFTLSPREFTFFNEAGRRRVMLYNTQKILSDIKNCTFKCLEGTTICAAAPPDLRETRPSKRMLELKSESTRNEISEFNKNIISLKENKIALELKRKRIASTIVVGKRLNKETSNMKIVNFAEEKKIVLNGRANIDSMKRDNYEDKITKTIHDNESRGTYNERDGNAISSLSEWSSWSYCANNKEYNSAKIVFDKVSKKSTNFQRLFNRTDRFNFLPRKLHGLLRHRHVKLTNVKHSDSPNVKHSDSPNDTISRKCPL